MFGPSLKSVPGCLVSIVPMLIGEPVAAAPGFGPHDEVLVDVLAGVLLALATALELLLAAVVAALELLELLLLPQPAIAMMPMIAAKATLSRVRGR
jgi:hypothetical protein